MKICKVNECDSIVKDTGMCNKHVIRYRRHGDPSFTKTNRHGMSKERIYKTYRTIISRCYLPSCSNYKYYGGRGITVCDRWLGKDGFLNFYADMGDRPSPNHSIDRVDCNGEYSPDNCRWASSQEQSRNRRVPSNNTSGQKGVHYSKSRSKWVATIKIRGKSSFLGHFNDIESAVNARKKAEAELGW